MTEILTYGALSGPTLMEYDDLADCNILGGDARHGISEGACSLAQGQAYVHSYFT